MIQEMNCIKRDLELVFSHSKPKSWLSLCCLCGMLSDCHIVVVLRQHEQHQHATEHSHGDGHGRGERVREHGGIVGVTAVDCAVA